jgi:uncharacterized protein with GYD domain
MPKYVTLFSLKGETAAGLMQRPTDRAAAVRETFRAAGGDVESFYWMLGPHDGLVIADVPDGQTMTAVMVAVSGSGAFTNLQTHELIAAEDIVPILERARSLAFSAPGA